MTNAAGRVAIVALLAQGGAALAYGWSLSAAPHVPIVIGGPALEQNALIYVAIDRGLFEKNGLNVTMRDGYPTGVGPVRDMIAGALDLSVSAEYPVLAGILAGGDISIIAAIDRYQNEKLVGRKDLGVREISDLRGRRIGLPRGTILEFFLGRLLERNGMALGDVTLVDVPSSRAADAIAGGEVDALMYFQLHVSLAVDRLGEDAIVWPGQGDQLLYGVVSARNDWIASHLGEIDRFLRSLDEARDYSLGHPDETMAIVNARLNLTDEYAAAIWPDHQVGLSLDHSLLAAMSDEARWMIANNLTPARTQPDLRDAIHTDGLARVDPEAVNIL